MKKLTKAHLKNRDEITESLRTRKLELDEAIETYNTVIQEAADDLGVAVSSMNDGIQDAREFCEGIVSEIDDYVSDRSEKWQESDAAQALESWKSEFENVDLEDINIEYPEPLEGSDFDEEALDTIQEAAE